MDTITHGILGGVTAQAILYRRHKAAAWIAAAGAVAAMLPDLDFLIRSKKDPLLALEYHRHFTHSLLFIPFGGFLAALIVWWLIKKRPPFSAVFLAATLGCATHGLLDAATTYGTLLLWPFSKVRISWDIISIIDPIFSLTLLIGLIVALRKKSGRPARLALLLALAYLGFGIYQHQRASSYQRELAAVRGHIITQALVTPSLGNLLVWRSVYASDGYFYIDAIRTTPWSQDQSWQGGQVPKFEVPPLFSSLPDSATLTVDLKRYNWFSAGYLGRLSDDEVPIRLGDLRYSAIPHGVIPIWGIQFYPENIHGHVQRLRFPFARQENFQTLWNMLRGRY